MSRILQTGDNQITNSYTNHNGWSKGVDIVKYKAQLDNIIAHSAGKVIKVINYLNGTNKVLDKEGMGYGNYVMILHNNKYQGKYVVTLYGHLNSVAADIKEGISVTKGKLLGAMGNTGNSAGAHLHFEIRLYSSSPVSAQLHDTTKFNWIDPTSYLDTNLPEDIIAVAGFLDTASWSKDVLTCAGWAYRGGGNQTVTISIYNSKKQWVANINTKANLSRPDVQNAMKYNTNQVGYVLNHKIKLEDGTYYIKAYVQGQQLTNTKTVIVKNELHSKSFSDYANGGKYYIAKDSKGTYAKWADAFAAWSKLKSQGYHIFNDGGKQLDK